MRVSRAPERFQQLLARAGVRVAARQPRVSFVGQGGDLATLWSVFKQALYEPADEPFRGEGELHHVRHELMQFEASAAGNFELLFERQFVYTEAGDTLGFALWVTFTEDPDLTPLITHFIQDRDSPADVARWVRAVESCPAFVAVTQRQATFALDAVG